MTIEEIRKSDKTYLTPADIADALDADAQAIRVTARETPELIRYPFTFIGCRMKVPRLGFLRWFDGEAT